MEGSDSKIINETVDRTDPSARAQGERRAQEENERRMRELRDSMERDRQQAFRKAQERAICEDEAQRRHLDQQRREREEMERRMKEGEALLKLRQEMMMYDFQICPRIRKESFKDLQVDDIDLIRIAVIGPTGSGKTSFIGTLQRAVGETEQSAFEQCAGRQGTILLEEYYVQKKIRMVDTRGFFESDEKSMDEFLNIMSGKIRPGDEILRAYDHNEANQNAATGAQALSKCAHAVIFVAKANALRFRAGKYEEILWKIRQHSRENGYTPVTVIIDADKLKTKEDIDANQDLLNMIKFCSPERTYFFTNYTHENATQSDIVDRSALKILDCALMAAESFIRLHKQREKNAMERKVMAGVATTGEETTAQFFARLKKKYDWTDQGKTKAVLEYLKKEEIDTVKILKELWEDIKSDLPLSMGLKVALEYEMKRM